ncbi:hypothetical protein FRX31_021636 [Thalictrum thalictroides]|uniref:Uncharacterized protein n=1 Tax=Thalictrum thalictroides TaxID=46969 RepID=A0A7J6VUK1_THATH|nr:hypothetical protein FRX31_021636 [Thalictrum thalictroides]
MDTSTPSDDSACEYSASDPIHTHVNHKQSMCSRSVTTEGNMEAEFGNTFSEVLHIQDAPEMTSGCTLAANGVGIYCHGKENLCEEVNSTKSNSTAGSDKLLDKSATFPLSKKNACVVGNDVQCSIASEEPSCRRSLSMSTSVKPVSAMKGSRERRGQHENILTLKWAPDVYDPPVTSLSHTVNGHSQQRSRTNKRNSKHKYKGKSSRGRSEKKQNQKHVENSEPLSKSEVTSNEMSHQLGADILDFSVTGKESNCGSSFLKTSVGKVHISFAETT